jgi:RNA polymerase sigma factor (sigma-70 family)
MATNARAPKSARITRSDSGYYVEGAALGAGALVGDGFKQYLREIGCLTLLATPEEQYLGWLIRRDREDAARDHEPRYISHELRNVFVERNLRLVVAVAKGYIGSGLSLDDLTQEGSFGLMHAAETYDERRAHFSTYAVWWIRQAISRAVGNYGRLIRYPIHVLEIRKKLKRVSSAFEQEHGQIAEYRRASQQQQASRSTGCSTCSPLQPSRSRSICPSRATSGRRQ